MKYMMKYLDASRHLMMKEIIESEGDAAYTLQQSCEKAARRHEQLKLRLSEKIPGVSPSRSCSKSTEERGRSTAWQAKKKSWQRSTSARLLAYRFIIRRRGLSEQSDKVKLPHHHIDGGSFSLNSRITSEH